MRVGPPVRAGPDGSAFAAASRRCPGPPRRPVPRPSGGGQWRGPSHVRHGDVTDAQASQGERATRAIGTTIAGMDARLVEFARVLRQNGLRVSPAEVADAARAATLTGLAERDAFRVALRSTMVKRATDVPAFDRLFDLYFSGLGRVLDGLER